MPETMPVKPTPGEECVRLYPPKGKRRKYQLKREVWAEGEKRFTTFYVDDLKDWVTWPGSWEPIETLAEVDTVDEAKAFMIARDQASPARESGGQA